MACPYFMPVARLTEPQWPFPARLPLGWAYKGSCTALRASQAGTQPDNETVLRHCNLGYAQGCAFLPPERTADANRFFVSITGNDANIVFCSELAHRPAQHAVLKLDLAARTWTSPHADGCVQRQAECAVESFVLRRAQRASASSQVVASPSAQAAASPAAAS